MKLDLHLKEINTRQVWISCMVEAKDCFRNLLDENIFVSDPCSCLWGIILNLVCCAKWLSEIVRTKVHGKCVFVLLNHQVLQLVGHLWDLSSGVSGIPVDACIWLQSKLSLQCSSILLWCMLYISLVGSKVSFIPQPNVLIPMIHA